MRQKVGAATFALLMVLSATLAMVAVGPAAGATLSGDQLATSTSGTFTEESYNGRMYMKYVPSSVDSTEDAPLLVMLHGCTQSPRGFADETKMNQVAEDEGFIVIYPDQTSSANQNECWNWFEDQHTTRGSGEAALIAGMTQETMSQHNVDDQRVYLAGFSAGGGMAPNMAAAYPDLYAAVGVAAGLEFDAAESMNDAFTVMSSGGPNPQQQGDAAYDAMGNNASPVPTAVWHGTADTTVDTVNGHQAAEQATQTNDWATDGTDDGNINYTAEVENSGQTAAGVSYTEYEYHNEEGIPVVEKYIVEGMDHAWAGGMSGGSYTAPDAPDASRRMWNFFEMHTRDQVGGGLNQAPTAVASASSTTISTGEEVTFDASGSEDSDGTIASYEWDLDGDGTVDATGQQTAKTYNSGGVYDVTLTVTDDTGESSTDTISLAVDAPGNDAPSASIDASTTTVIEGNAVDFDASGSTDTDGTIESYEWDFDGDGTVDATGQQASHTYDTAGTYDATLTVTDNEGAEATTSVTITVEAFEGYCGEAYPYEHESNGRAVADGDGSYSAVGSGDDLGFGGSTVTLDETSENYFEKVDSCDGGENAAPTAEASASSTSVVTGEEVTFDASGSSDSDGTIQSYEWDFDGDGTVDATGQQVSHTYDTAGTYDVTLTVTDDAGAASTDTVSVTVETSDNTAPSASIDVSATTVNPGEEVTFDASGSSDSDGTIESYEWDFDGDGTVDATGQQVAHTYDTAGTFEVTLTVTDNDGADATSTVTITVEEFSGYCGSAYPYEHENNGRAVSNADGSYSAVGSGDDLGYGGSQVTLEETSENYFEEVDSCDGGGDDGGDDWWW